MSRFTAADDLRHEIEGEHGRESLFWVLPLPDEELAVMAYVWRDAGTDRWGRLFAVGGEDPHTPLVFDFQDGVEMEGDDLRDFTVAGLHVRQPDPLASAELSFDGFSARLDALHEPFSWHENRDGCPAWAAADRFEQSMRTAVTLELGDRSVKTAGVGHRDHSWGPRDWRALQHWKWMNAATHDGAVSLHAWESLAYADRHVLGYVNRGGAVTPIAAVRVESTLDARLVHRSQRVEIADAAGGETVLETTFAAGVIIPVGGLNMNEMAMRATIDGADATAHVEYGWQQAYLAPFA